MLKKIKRKILFLRSILGLGANWGSKLILLRAFSRLQYYRNNKAKERPFSCHIQAQGRTAYIHFTGSMSEIHTLVDIFVDHSYKPKHDYIEKHLSGSIRTLLDLGANIGLASAWFALTYPHISIHAYEPNPQVFVLLEKNMSSFPNVRVYNKAIAAKKGVSTFYQSVYTLESSMFATQGASPAQVETETLDEAIDAIGSSVDLIKMDIVGAEFEALGASKKLDHVRAIIGEAHTEQSGHKQEELLELLSSFNILEIYNPNLDTVFGFYAARFTRQT